jgi:hypothetical protein
MIDEMKDIAGYEGLFAVTRSGKVWSYPREKVGFIKSLREGKFRSLQKMEKGYLAVILHKNSNQKRFLVHRLVAMAFIPNLEDKPAVNHKDGDKTNNCVDNLEWVTASENNFHSYRVLGTKHPQKGKIGILNHSSIPVVQYSRDGKLINIFAGMSEVARAIGVGVAGISGAVNGDYKTIKGYVWKRL